MRCQRGYSLMEALMVMAITSILLVIVASIYSTGMGYWTEASGALERYQNVRIGVSRIIRETRMAREIVDAGPGSLTFRDRSDHIVSYYLDDGTLYRSVDAGQGWLVAAGLDRADFGFNQGVVTVELASHDLVLRGTVYLRMTGQ